MRHSYFKVRERWNFKPHKFEIGTPVFRSDFHDNHFLLKLCKLDQNELPDFYNFHLHHYVKHVPDGEQDFHRYVSDIVSTRIAQLKLIDPFSQKSLRAKKEIEKLSRFQKFLTSIDQWNSSKALEIVIAENSKEMVVLKERIADLESQLQALRQFEPSNKIDIREKHLPTFVHLVHQLQDLVFADERRLFNFQGQSAWYKLLSKYFTHGRKPIPIETARNYFPVQKENTIKKIEIPGDSHHFSIILNTSKPSK